MAGSNPCDATARMDRVRARLIADSDLQMRLSLMEDPEPFVAAAIEIAGEAGVALTRGELHEALQPDPLGIARFSGASITGQAPPPGDWLPTAMVWSEGGPAIDWAHFAGKPLGEPFFEDSIRDVRGLPINRLLRPRTPLKALADWVGDDPPVPDGFIFHQSRCGSTLVAQMLAADRETIVVSEAPPIDAVVQLAGSRPDLPLHDRIRLLRAMVGALGRRRTGGERHYVVKLDSWHAFALPLFRQAFPDTPWVFLYRDPVEILVSHGRMAGMQTVPGSLPFDPYGIPRGEAMAPIAYAACALARTAETALDHHRLGGGLLVNYADLPGAMETQILPHFGIAPDAATRSAMAMVARRDSKRPIEPFRDDRHAKQQAASPDVRAAAAAYMDAPYRRLEALRLAGRG